MIFSLFLSFIFLFCASSNGSITISNGAEASVTRNLGLDEIIKNTCQNYFKPLEKCQKEQAIQARLRHFENKKEAEATQASAEMIPKIEKVPSETISLLEKHFELKPFLEIACSHYCSYILNKYKYNTCAATLEILEKPLINFWQISLIETFFQFNDHFMELKNTINTIEAKLRIVKIATNNSHVQESITMCIEPRRATCTNLFDSKLQEFYEKTESLELGDFSFSKPGANINCVEICQDFCRNFFYKIINQPNNSVEIKFIFNALFNQFQLHLHKKQASISIEFEPNTNAVEKFFESIIRAQPLFNGCFQYLESLSNQHYPQNIEAAVKRFLLNEPVSLYQLFLNHQAIDIERQLERMQQEAMTVVGSFYKGTIDETINKKYQNRNMSKSIIDNYAYFFQTALFADIYFNNYPELDETFKEAFENFDIDNLAHNNQNAVNQLVLDAHKMVKTGIKPTQWQRFRKKYGGRILKIFIVIAIVTAYMLIVQLIPKTQTD